MGETVKTGYFAAVILLAIVAILIYRLYSIFAYRTEEPENEPIDCGELQKDVAELHSMMQRLAELDSAILELKLCRPAEQMRSFRVEWQSVSGTDHVVDFMADGESESSESFKLWAVNERIRLNQDITQRIYDLYAKASYINHSPASETLSGEWSETAELVDGDRFLNENSAGEW